VGGLAAGVGVDEVVDDVGLETVGEVPHVEGDAQLVADPARVGGVLQGAAAAGGLTHRLRVARERQVDTDYVVAGRHHPRRGHRRVDAAAHRRQYAHALPPSPLPTVNPAE